MEKVFLDSNVVIDFLLDRVPFAESAGELFMKAEDGELELFVCAGSFDNLYYIMRNHDLKHEQIIFLFRKMNRFVRAVAVDFDVVKNAIDHGHHDFEDAIQFFCARKVKGLKTIISRDKRGFSRSKLTVLSAEEYLKTFN